MYGIIFIEDVGKILKERENFGNYINYNEKLEDKLYKILTENHII